MPSRLMGEVSYGLGAASRRLQQIPGAVPDCKHDREVDQAIAHDWAHLGYAQSLRAVTRPYLPQTPTRGRNGCRSICAVFDCCRRRFISDT
jgi:hypothetical protein